MTDKTNTQRQARRRAALNQAAQAAGYQTWAQYETAVINGKIALNERTPDYLEAPRCKCVLETK